MIEFSLEMPFQRFFEHLLETIEKWQKESYGSK